MEELIEQRLNALLSEPFDNLRLLPKSREEDLVLEGKKIKVTTFHEGLEAGKHRVVIQAIRERLGGITAKVVASGYEISGLGDRRKLTAEELYEYT